MPDLMKGKRGLIMGVANDHSIAWGIAKALAAQGAELAFTYQGEALGKRVKPLAQSLGVEARAALRRRGHRKRRCRCSRRCARNGARSISSSMPSRFSDKNELKGLYADTTRENFSRTMVISCFSFTELAKRAAELMPNGGSMLTLTYRRLDARDAELQRDGRGQGGAGSVGALSRRRFRPAAASASTRSRRDRSARWRAPASAMRARCLLSSRSIRRSAAACRSRSSAAPRFICCRICRAA